ncbi:hypothetical protein [Streptomyces sp. NRRL S-475]|uniref:hypothetical protein n=1 Tax=Streptomyces sp. NRRL S-475 TaxID=1463910 RepID=UPI0004BDF205|nr:hypothetical protein [Streptomyces sp. NRRL S-475]
MNEFDSIRDGLAAAMMEVEHNLMPMIDAMHRMRCELVSRGWSVDGAERAATAWFSTLMAVGRQ